VRNDAGNVTEDVPDIRDHADFARASPPLEMSSALKRLKMSLATSLCFESSVWTEIRMLPSRIFAS